MTAATGSAPFPIPFSRRTTLTYDATSGKIKSIVDSLRPDHQLHGRIPRATWSRSPAPSSASRAWSTTVQTGPSPGSIPSATGPAIPSTLTADSRQATTPLGQVTSLTYNTNQTLVTNPRGYVTTLNFTSNGSLSSAIDGTGNLTSYSWDAANRLTAIVDGLGNATSFAYTTWAT